MVRNCGEVLLESLANSSIVKVSVIADKLTAYEMYNCRGGEVHIVKVIVIH